MKLDVLYENRFSENRDTKNGVWIEITKWMNRFWKSEYDSVVDVAAGYCEFVNNFNPSSDVKKFAFDANPDVDKTAVGDVKTIVDTIDNLENHFDKESISVFFMSNFLEHIEKSQIEKLFSDTYGILKKGGQLWILTPNIKYVGGKYWDFWDHITPITDEALIEAAKMYGYKPVKTVKRFLPFTTKSSLPQSQWIVGLYLKLMPLSGAFFGEQSFLVMEKED